MYQTGEFRRAPQPRLAAISAKLSGLRLSFSIRRIRLLLQKRYDPNQPRVPAGLPEGGQWTNGGGGRSTPGSFREQFAQAFGSSQSWTDRTQAYQRESEAQSKRDTVANWAENQIGSQDFQLWD